MSSVWKMSGRLSECFRALTATRDPLLAALSNAPPDDEAETDAEREAIERARQNVREGNTRAHEDVRRKLRAREVADPPRISYNGRRREE